MHTQTHLLIATIIITIKLTVNSLIERFVILVSKCLQDLTRLSNEDAVLMGERSSERVSFEHRVVEKINCLCNYNDRYRLKSFA